jgi:hypothetical protein
MEVGWRNFLAMGRLSSKENDFGLTAFARAVEGFDGDRDLCPAAFVDARFQRIADNALVSTDRRLDARSLVVNRYRAFSSARKRRAL